jgi:hypothetical protein
LAQGTTRGVPIDTDPLLTADSDLLVPSQKAIKAYTDTKGNMILASAQATLAGLAVANTFTERQTIAAPSLTGSSALSALNITQTLNTSGSPDIISLDFTNTVSGPSTNLLNFKQVGGASLFKVSKFGEAVMVTAKIGTISFVSNNVMGAATAGDLRIVIPTTTKALVLSSDYSSSTGTSAILEVKSTVQGFLPPRMTTTQKNAIGTPTTGLVVFDTTLNKLCVFVSPSWQTITSI